MVNAELNTLSSREIDDKSKKSLSFFLIQSFVFLKHETLFKIDEKKIKSDLNLKDVFVRSFGMNHGYATLTHTPPHSPPKSR